MKGPWRHSEFEGRGGPGLVSGLLVLICIARVFAGLYTPAGLLLGEDSFFAKVKEKIFYLVPDDTSSLTEVSASFSYDDYYHAKSIDETKTPSLRAEALAESPRFSGEAFVKRPHWALSPSWDVRKGFARSSNAEDIYFYRGALNSDKAGISGWISSKSVVFAGYIGWNFLSIRDHGALWKNEFPNNQIASNLARKKCDYSLSAGWGFNDILLSAFIEKSLLPIITVSIINTGNNAAAEFNYIGQRRTVGIRAAIKRPAVRADVDARFSDFFSDTASSAASSIPMTINSRMLHGKAGAEISACRLQPWLSLSGGVASPEVRGFDGAGGPLFFNLDRSESQYAAASLGLDPRGKFKTGLTAETFSFRNLASGRLDPFLFSTMTFFFPDKYKIDSLAVSYASYGIFGGKQIKPSPWWLCDGFVSVSRVKVTSFSNTREYDFSNIIPRLVNPQKNVFLDEDYALCIIRLTNALSLHKATISVAVQQAIPINLKSQKTGKIHGEEPGENITKSARGAARYCVGVGYEW
jgi:hypothetical protein